MKKLALALMAVSASIFGLTAVANAYPPAADVSVVSNSNPGPGEQFTVSMTAPQDSAVIAEFDGSKAFINVPVERASKDGLTGSLLGGPDAEGAAVGTATFTFTAPTTPGIYTGSYSGGAFGAFSITVSGRATPVAPAGSLPATGTSSTNTMTIIAIGLVAVGAGLSGISQLRRRTVVA